MSNPPPQAAAAPRLSEVSEMLLCVHDPHSNSHAGRNDPRLQVLPAHGRPLHCRSKEGARGRAEGGWRHAGEQQDSQLQISRRAVRYACTLKPSQLPYCSPGPAPAPSLVPTTGHPSVLMQPCICGDSPSVPLLPHSTTYTETRDQRRAARGRPASSGPRAGQLIACKTVDDAPKRLPASSFVIPLN